MPEWLLGQGDELGQVVAKAALMYVVALVGLRVAHRRTLSQWTAIDFAAAVAIGPSWDAPQSPPASPSPPAPPH